MKRLTASALILAAGYLALLTALAYNLTEPERDVRREWRETR